ncbi:hypothetical protein [Streptomyces sp. NPDC057702]|uniref:hypothetical protein n=1 Tax=unclassified Streptomyces TaxID=2593676 RepID=UPI00368B49EB
MDQGEAAVWAAGLAGFATVAAAGLGAFLGGRSARSQQVDSGELDRERRLEEWRRAAYGAFHEHLSAAVIAVDACEAAVRAGRPVDEEDSVVRGALAVALQTTYTVRECSPVAITELADAACLAVKEAAESLRALRRQPDAPDAVREAAWQRWEEARLRVTVARSLLADAIRATMWPD